MGDFLTNSIILSIALTVGFNLVLWLGRRRGKQDPFGGIPPADYGSGEIGQRSTEAGDLRPPSSGDEWLDGSARDLDPQTAPDRRPKVRVFFPWKAMLIGSIGLTILINLLNAFR